jgi:1,4-alpha-glucan branching enzyme
MGANLTHGGATFRTWAPAAERVSLVCSANGWQEIPLQRQSGGYWYIFVPGVREGDEHKFQVVGNGSLARSVTRTRARSIGLDTAIAQ